MKSPNAAGGAGILRSVTAVSANDVWAVGDDTQLFPNPLIEHYDGKDWSTISIPGSPTGQLFSVAADSPSDVWAVGLYDIAGGQSRLIEHWDGTAWQVVASPTWRRSAPATPT